MDTISMRETHILLLQQQKKAEVQKAGEKINRNYVRFLAGEAYVFTEIIEDLDKMYHGLVRRQLMIAGCYDEENEHIAMQEARLAVWTVIHDPEKKDEIQKSLSSYCRGVYYYKTQDVIRKICKEQKKSGGPLDSLDRTMPSENSTLGDLMKVPRYEGDQPERILAEKEQRKLFADSFQMYCQVLGQTEADPAGKLALHYARILPHVLQIDYGTVTIPDQKAASPKWAVRRMEKKTVGVLGRESEAEMQRYVMEAFRWSRNFWEQLEKKVSVSRGMISRKDLIYTEEYDEKQIGHMTDYMHKVVVKAWLKEVRKDPEFLEAAIEYTAGIHKISAVLKGGRGR